MLVMAGALLTSTAAAGQTPYDNINAMAAAAEIQATSLRGGVSLLQGSGGNIGVLAGPEGFFLVDTGIAVSKEKILAALQALGPGPIRYALNTHWHWDHADGNEWVRAAGGTVIASRNTDRRLGQTIRVVEWQHTFTPNAAHARPNMLLEAPKVLRLNNEEVLIRPYVHGHTDGDLSVYFRKADVLLTGDTWWNGQYPFIDYVAGGSIDGAIRLANANIAMAKQTTIVVPGHGPAGTRAQLIEFRDMLVSARARVARLKAKGMSLEEVLIERPTADLDPRWGQSIIDGSTFTSLVYRGV
jgi:glyoxylase-like metal-dependent hydrolase (beta-lactamase superfamily II)